jgi:hypothetical protein
LRPWLGRTAVYGVSQSVLFACLFALTVVPLSVGATLPAAIVGVLFGVVLGIRRHRAGRLAIEPQRFGVARSDWVWIDWAEVKGVSLYRRRGWRLLVMRFPRSAIATRPGKRLVRGGFYICDLNHTSPLVRQHIRHRLLEALEAEYRREGIGVECQPSPTWCAALGGDPVPSAGTP